MIKSIGFTGTQRGMTSLQMTGVEHLLWSGKESGAEYFHHGDCIGADAEAHYFAERDGYWITTHPPINPSKRAFCVGNAERDCFEYLTRNHHIVDECELLIACPGEKEEQLRSGTWATIRYARKKLRRLVIIFPDGAISRENVPGAS